MVDSYYLERVTVLSVILEHPNTFVQLLQYRISSCSSKINSAVIWASHLQCRCLEICPLWIPSPSIQALESEESCGTCQAGRSVPMLPVVLWVCHTDSVRSTGLYRGPDTKWEFSLVTVETACVSLGRTPGRWRQCGLENIKVGSKCWSKGHFCSQSSQNNFT